MSYCRKGPESDVYLYQTEVGIVCDHCKITSGHDKWLNLRTALAHLLRHREFGHKVPQAAIDRLKEEGTEMLEQN